MNTFSGNGRVGLLALFAVLLMPLLGIGTASAIEVNDRVSVLIPDLQQFPAEMETELFTCRAVTEHAVWLVQDTSFVDVFGGYADTTFVPKIVWGTDGDLNLVDPTFFDTLTTSFENNVWGTVTDVCGVPVDLNSDGKVVIILAAIPTKFAVTQQTQAPANICYHVDPELNKIEDEAMEVFYLNIHPNTSKASTMIIANEMREWNLANGLSALSMSTTQPSEKAWLMRGISSVMQYRCFGLTKTTKGRHGLNELMFEFSKAASLELISSTSGYEGYDYVSSRGQQFMWLMYLAQREGDSIISTVAKDTVNTGMLSIALAIDPSADEETAVLDNVVPLYNDWLVCNLANIYRSDYAGGIYSYAFLEGTFYENFSHYKMTAALSILVKKVDDYPIVGAITPESKGMGSAIWSAQYSGFKKYDKEWVTNLNCQYSDGMGANGALNSKWEGVIVKFDEDAEELVSVEPLDLDAFYNTSFTLTESSTFIILTNNNPGGKSGMRYFFSNDHVLPEVEISLHQNAMSSQYITTYCTLFDVDSLKTEGFDWVGPIFEALHVKSDSTQNIKMKSFYSDLFYGTFSAWTSGNYELSVSGYDSSGHFVQDTKDLAVGYADADISLNLGSISLDVPMGGAASGSMVTLAETGTLGIAIESSLTVGNARGRMTGILAGPVSVSQVTGTLSFQGSTSASSVYRYTNEGWVMINSWIQNGVVSATIDQGGIYALGEGFGVFSPEVPAKLVLAGNAPNPFTSQTAITFGLPVSGNVSMSVFDMTGRLVTAVVNEEMAAANHTIIWDGTDSTGSSVGAGVYFCRLETAGQVLTQKMLKVQ